MTGIYWLSVMLYGVVVVGIFYLWNLWTYTYWKKKGVPGPNPTFVLGNVGNIFRGDSLGQIFFDIYNQTKPLPYAGVYLFLRKTFVINDLELIKTVLVKDFIHFTDHGAPTNEDVEPLSAHLFNLTGEKWKKLRNKLSPTFTSSKIKYMFETVSQCSTEMTKYLNARDSDEEVMDMKDLLAKFNTDVIGSCAFGIECNSFTNPDAEFRRMGRKIFEISFFQYFLRFCFFFVPSLVNKRAFSLIGKNVNEFFYKTVANTIKFREENNVVRNDFMQLLIQLKNDGFVADDEAGKSETLPDDGTRLTLMQIAAQVFVFFVAGFETSSTTASFALYELALNPDIQGILRTEIDEVLGNYEGKVTYEALGEMVYLTKVIEETLRKYPPLPVIFRICTKDYIVPGTDIKIEKETPVMIPILGIQRDPEFFPEPMKFDPERFTPENKAARHHFSYLPFGEGPRLCIGSRFGMLETRLGLVSILSTYEVSVCDKTHIPMVYDNRNFILTAYGGVWLKLTKLRKEIITIGYNLLDLFKNF